MLDSLDLDADTCPRIDVEWPQLKSMLVPTSPDEDRVSVAIICIGPGSELVRGILADGSWELISLTGSVAISLQHPTLLPMILQRSTYRNTYTAKASLREADNDSPTTGDEDATIETLGTTAFLVCRQDASDALVQAALEALYRSPTLVGLIPADHAAEWQGLAFHRAARAYFHLLAK